MRIINARDGADVRIGGRFLSGDGRQHVLRAVPKVGLFSAWIITADPEGRTSLFQAPIRHTHPSYMWQRVLIIPS